MKHIRRHFIETALAGSAAASLPSLYFQSEKLKDKYARLDEIIKKPVLKTNLFTAPVIIEKLELLKYPIVMI